MGRFTGKSCRFSTMLLMTTSFFLVEIVVGYLTNSIALVADSFHMLSDVVALIVGFVSIKIAKWPSKRNTYGWVRAEVLGALVNAVFLLALCFSILVESLKRLVTVETVDNPKLMLIVGGLGLLINVIGLFLFSGHGHSHGGHGHGGHGHGGKKGDHGHSHAGDDKENHSHGSNADPNHLKDTEVEIEALVSSPTVSEEDGEMFIVEASEMQDTISIEMKQHNQPKKTAASMNMRGVFLHVLGDALGSVVVVVSALVIWFCDGYWKYYVDPAMSMLMVIIILSTTIPLFKESAFILLQTVPSHVDVDTIKKELEKIDGIVGVHECHIWQLAGNRIVASAHIRCRDVEEYMSLASKIKTLFHKAGIHSTTIQPEFFDYTNTDSKTEQVCALLCTSTGQVCQDTCCGDRSSLKENGKDAIVTGVNNSNSNRHRTDDRPRTDERPRSMSFASKMSVDGDEIVLEMTEVTSE